MAASLNGIVNCYSRKLWHELQVVSTNQRDYPCPVLEKFKFHAVDSLGYGLDTV